MDTCVFLEKVEHRRRSTLSRRNLGVLVTVYHVLSFWVNLEFRFYIWKFWQRQTHLLRVPGVFSLWILDFGVKARFVRSFYWRVFVNSSGLGCLLRLRAVLSFNLLCLFIFVTSANLIVSLGFVGCIFFTVDVIVHGAYSTASIMVVDNLDHIFTFRNFHFTGIGIPLLLL